MKRGSGLNSAVIFIIVIFIAFKVVLPKFLDKTGDTVGVYSGLTELSNAIDEFREYYFKNGNFTTISIMTYVNGFENTSQKLEFDKPVRYGVSDSKGIINYCAELVVTSDGYIEVKSLNNRSEVCKAFTESQKFQNMRKTPLKL
ncbi:MAG: hypothetical protein GX282_04075 [Campylobacteraceae bacterium]|nr:hypothetical protein [Campylobacteraceae bacterium]